MKYIVFVLILACMGISCNRKTDNNTKQANEEVLLSDSNAVPKSEVDPANINSISVTKKAVNDTVHCSGSLVVAPDARRTVTISVSGSVVKMYVSEEMHVKKGQPIALIESQEYLDMQQQYVIAKHRLQYYQKNFKRQGELTLENAASIKHMEKVQKDYHINNVKLKRYRQQLQLLGRNPDSVTTETITAHLTVYAPISGYVNNCDIQQGSYLKRGVQLCDFANVKDLLVSKKLPAQNSSIIKQDMDFSFMPAHEGSHTKYHGSITKYGKQVVNQKISLWGKPSNVTKSMLPGMKINAYIPVQREPGYVIPADAAIKDTANTWVFLQTDNRFVKYTLAPYQSYGSYIRLSASDSSLFGKRIVGEGASCLARKLDSINNME